MPRKDLGPLQKSACQTGRGNRNMNMKGRAAIVGLLISTGVSGITGSRAHLF